MFWLGDGQFTAFRGECVDVGETGCLTLGHLYVHLIEASLEMADAGDGSRFVQEFTPSVCEADFISATVEMGY
jgi:hypothetical protein